MFVDPNDDKSRGQDQPILSSGKALESVPDQHGAKETDRATDNPPISQAAEPQEVFSPPVPDPFAPTDVYDRGQGFIEALRTSFFAQPAPKNTASATAPTLPDPLPKDFQIGQYRIVEKIGQGGMGTVYRATHTRLKKQFAIKILPVAKTADPKAIARFSLEMEAVGRLDHPNVVRATDAGDHDGCHYLAMELIEGADLGRILSARKTLSVCDACELIRQAATGLQSAHESGLVHRDIKPSNLLLSKDGTLKILDLGLARLNTTADKPESEGSVMGTPDYMAPEQWIDSDATDIRSDLYSLGCTLYALLTGRPPFYKAKSDGHTRKMAAHFEDQPEPVVKWREDIPKELIAIIDRLLSKYPDERYATPSALVHDLQPLTIGANLAKLAASVLNDPGAGTEQTKSLAKTVEASPTRRYRRLSIIVGIALLLILLLTSPRWLAPLRTKDRPTASGDMPVAISKEPRKIVPGVWFDLLETEPAKFNWLENNNNISRWDYDVLNKTLIVDNTESGMINFAEIEQDSFELEATIYQNPWTGGFGFFYFPSDDGMKWTARSLRFELKKEENGFLYFACTHCLLFAPAGEKINFGQYLNKNNPIPIPGPHRFTIKVDQGIISEAKIDDLVCAKELSSYPTYDSSNRKKIVGIYIDSSSIKIQSIRIRTLANAGKKS